MYYNKRLHPRQYQYVEHKTGCVLREFADAPPPQAQKITHHSSMSSLDSPSSPSKSSSLRSRRHTSTTISGSGAAKRDYYRPSSVVAPPSVVDSDDSIGGHKGSSTSVSRKTSESSLKMVSFSSDCVDRQGYDSPERIIADLFPESVRNIGGGGHRNLMYNLRKGSVDSYLSGSKSTGGTFQRQRKESQDRASPTKRKSIYRPDSLQSIERDFMNLKYGRFDQQKKKTTFY